MKKILLFVLIVLIIVGSVLVYRQFQALQVQVIERPLQAEDITDVKDCQKLSENAANNCIQRLAILQDDASLCDDISKSSIRKSCKREVELAP